MGMQCITGLMALLLPLTGLFVWSLCRISARSEELELHENMQY